MRLLREKTIWFQTKEGMQILSQDAAVEEEGQVCHKYTSGETYSINNKDFVHYKTPITMSFT